MKVRIDLDGGDTAWRQIADQVRAHLVEGRLSPGTRLATVREPDSSGRRADRCRFVRDARRDDFKRQTVRAHPRVRRRRGAGIVAAVCLR